MTRHIHGIHHITAIASNPQKTVDFYTRILGLRLVKKSVNQDDVQTYHLFFGDKTGEPGMDLTFFTFQPAMPGLRGTGQVTTISLAVPQDALDFWLERFDVLKVKHEGRITAFGHERVIFYDFDDQKLELVGVKPKELAEMAEPDSIWTTSEVGKKVAIRCFFSARLSVVSKALIEPVLDLILGYQVEAEDGQVTLYRLPDHKRAVFLEVEEVPSMEQGFGAAGTVHHIAFAVSDAATELKIRAKIIALGLYPTEIIDRYYFKSVYFRTPAGILFELATLGPGFTADEAEETLGEKLALPPFLEGQRAQIEAGLTPIKAEKCTDD